jgi:putative N6-adenine-specific DNA methylase
VKGSGEAGNARQRERAADPGDAERKRLFGLPTGGSVLRLIAACSFGLESLVARELAGLGYGDPTVENGRVEFSASPAAVARCNLWLRSADRLLIVLAFFPASSFDELFAGVQLVPWADFLPLDGRILATARSVKSRLTSLPACQSTIKKAIVESLRRRYQRQWFPESGPLYAVEVSIRDDWGTLTLDTSGDGLHRRGYRTRAGAAPLRENLAAALVLLSRWSPSRVLADPFCGSGTIPVEAAMAGLGLAPGLRRSFSAEGWPHLPRRLWQEAREEARDLAQRRGPGPGAGLEILASDKDPRMISLARENARRAGVEGVVSWQTMPAERFYRREPFGCLVCNPPYGERTGESSEVEALYGSLGQVFARLDRWSAFVLTAHPRFEQHFGRRADRNRKMYNGNLKTYLYQYFGPLPRATDPETGAPAPEAP